MKLTKRQEAVLECIHEHIEATGYPPTRAEISTALGFKSANSAEDHLKALAKKGAIEIIPGTSRGIRLPKLASVPKGIPIIGRVAAGSPILAQEHIEEHCTLSADFFHPPAHYLLKVRGSSMKDIGIMDGDLLAVHQCTEVRNGQIVVARMGNDVTVKRFKKNGHMVYLTAENSEFSVIEINLKEQNLSIEGLGVGVIRQGKDL